MVVDLCGGEPSELQVTGYTSAAPKTVRFPLSETSRLTGIDVPRDAALSILDRLGFTPSGTGDTVDVTVPSWRPDVDVEGAGKADLVEEIMRIHGVDKIAPQPLASHDAVNGRILTTLQIRTRLARRALAVRGMMEAVTWSFIPGDHAKAFGGGSDALRLANPIAADMSDMRPSLFPGLIAAAGRNAARGMADVALFEVSGIYEGDTPDAQRRVAGGIRKGTATMTGAGRQWDGNAKPVGVFDAKADAIAVLEACGAPVDRLMIERDAPNWYHPGRSGVIKLGPKLVLGSFGELHPSALELLDVSGPVCGFEVFVDAIPEGKRKPTRTKPRLDLSQFQALRRDFAFVVDRAVPAGEIMKAALAADRKLVSAANVFDLFEGASLGENKKSVAIEVAIQPVDKTLTDDDLETLTKAIIANVTKQTGGVLRG
jgi:phenylalanyl-tRNA synthetase beta chain